MARDAWELDWKQDPGGLTPVRKRTHRSRLLQSERPVAVHPSGASFLLSHRISNGWFFLFPEVSSMLSHLIPSTALGVTGLRLPVRKLGQGGA